MKTREPKFVILPGRGVEGCEIGFDKATAREVFGKPQKEGTKYLHFYKAGLDVYTDFFTKTILSFNFFFIADEHRRFSAHTSDGIGCGATVADVLAAHGNPDDKGHSGDDVTQTLMYWQLGMVYTFAGHKLEHITVTDPQRDEKNGG